MCAMPSIARLQGACRCSGELSHLSKARTVIAVITDQRYEVLLKMFFEAHMRINGRPQVVRVGNSFSSTLTLSTGAPQGCVLSPLLYSLFTHDCVARHTSNTIFQFADDTTILGLITDGDETAYRDEVSALSEWCYHNNLSLNISRTKEMIVDYRKLQRGGHSPLYINGAEVERVSSVRFLGVHLTDDLSWSLHTNKVVRSARQRLFFLRRLRKFGLPPDILTNFYRCTIESILTACITVWYGSCTAYDRKALKRVVRTAESIIGSKLPDLQDIYRSRCLRKIQKIRLDCSHPAHDLFTLLPSGRRYRSIQARTNRLMNSFYPQAIRQQVRRELSKMKPPVSKPKATVARKNSLRVRGRNLERNQDSKGEPILLWSTPDISVLIQDGT
ncbi:hypothetical protein NFI96_007913 [Prochilodus magdalenae]|nr:hypothetical protein NFI96_007913 [Prochilodus magdalenae]